MHDRYITSIDCSVHIDKKNIECYFHVLNSLWYENLCGLRHEGHVCNFECYIVLDHNLVFFSLLTSFFLLEENIWIL